jgi:hypothetical protein
MFDEKAHEAGAAGDARAKQQVTAKLFQVFTAPATGLQLEGREPNEADHVVW